MSAFVRKDFDMRLGVRIWNKIPESFKIKIKVNIKRKHLQTELLQFLMHEGDYVGVYNLADRLFSNKEYNTLL